MIRRALVTLVLLVAVAFPRTARADCVDVGCVVGWVYVLLIPVMVGGVVVAGVDAYEATADVSGAARHVAPSSDRAGFEVVWGGWQAALGGVSGSIVLAGGDADTGGGLLAFTTLPLALTMHGAWGSRGDPYRGFPVETVPVAALDTLVLGLDATRLAHGEHGSTWLGIAEAIGATPQLAFGIAQSVGGRPRDAAPTLALSTFPALMLAHGIFAIASPGHAIERTEAPAATRASWSIAPVAIDGPRAWALGVAGAF